MTKRTTRKSAVDMNRISDSHRQQIERVVQIGQRLASIKKSRNAKSSKPSAGTSMP